MIYTEQELTKPESIISQAIEKYPQLNKPQHKSMLNFLLRQDESGNNLINALSSNQPTGGSIEIKLAELAIKTLQNGKLPNELALFVVLSRLLSPLTYDDIQLVWRELQLTEAFNHSPEDAFLSLANSGFLSAEILKEINYFSVSEIVKRKLHVSQEDNRNAHIALANFYTKKVCDVNFNEGNRAKAIQFHLMSAGLDMQSVQMTLSLLPELIEKKMFPDAYDLLKMALEVSESELRLTVMIRLQFASVCLVLNRMLEATEAMEKAIGELDELENMMGAMATRNQLAAIYASNGQMKKARAKFLEIFETQDQLKNISGVAAAASQLGIFLHHTKSDFEAVKYLYVSHLLSSSLEEEEAELHRRNFEGIRMELGEVPFNEIMRSVEEEAEMIVSKYRS
ncbi:MAG: hypothetical protein SFU91_00955 [Chloroherpetonaceae bacterium]|nr:hypothetical protein [Chloroherpetonaceae bacterium]